MLKAAQQQHTALPGFEVSPSGNKAGSYFHRTTSVNNSRVYLKSSQQLLNPVLYPKDKPQLHAYTEYNWVLMLLP